MQLRHSAIVLIVLEGLLKRTTTRKTREHLNTPIISTSNHFKVINAWDSKEKGWANEASI